jgi:AcrR family transcriptional regulator
VQPRRTPLSRDRVLAAAVELADGVGIESLSMRRLAQELGVVPMALYKHVASKDELLDGMVDAVLAEVPPADPALDWQDGVRQRVLSARRAVLAHPWARTAIESRTRRTPVVLAYMDSLAGVFRAGGFSVDLTHHVMHTLGNRMWGFSPELFEEPPPADQPPPDPAAQQAMMAEFVQRYPHIVEIAQAATQADPERTGCDEDFEFGFALDLLLEGFERLRAQGWTSTRR